MLRRPLALLDQKRNKKIKADEKSAKILDNFLNLFELASLKQKKILSGNYPKFLNAIFRRPLIKEKYGVKGTIKNFIKTDMLRRLKRAAINPLFLCCEISPAIFTQRFNLKLNDLYSSVLSITSILIFCPPLPNRV
ncbi:MAG: hypothetical protein DWQ05_07685 [Calditrichaeota bacterium]|nr:MAG: hypothetical protein DWQ05_07685 [Calditrichota bacterium]